MKLFCKICNLIMWAVPAKNLKICFKDFCASLDLSGDLKRTQENYKRVLCRLKKSYKIKVIFLIREEQKWSYQSLYEELAKSDKFEPLILVSMLMLASTGKDKTRNNIEENYRFFKNKGMNVAYAYEEGEYLDLETFAPDIVFYDQMWDLPEKHKPQYVSRFALTCYCSYSYELLDNRETYIFEFHRFLYKFFVDNEFNLKRYKKYNTKNADNCVVTGYPKLDEYLKPNEECELWKDKSKFKIIYAPHHSLEKNSIHFATFLQNGKVILELAKTDSRTTWVFKPHPRLKYALLKNKLMSEEEIKDYFSQWEQVGSVCSDGDYFNLFKTSDLMITDSVSFLAEYLPVNKPVVRLVNKRAIPFNMLGNMISNTCYNAENVKKLVGFLEYFINKQEDYKKSGRMEVIKKIFNTKEKAGEKIYQHIISLAG